MEIKVGEYVRTKRGIAKVLEVKIVQTKMHGQHDVAYKIDKCPGMYITETAFTEHSFNLIDLIEVGDIVFIQDVLNNDFVYIYDDEMLKAVKEDVESGLEITEILTHEQYETNCYKINKTPTK